MELGGKTGQSWDSEIINMDRILSLAFIAMVSLVSVAVRPCL